MEDIQTNRIIVIGDLHGDIGMLCSCLYMTNIINTDMEWIAEPQNTVVVQIGDQLDSENRDTDENWEKIEDLKLIQFTDQLDTIAKKKGGRFISLLGNHELMNVLGNYSYVSSFSMEKSGGEFGRLMKFSPGGPYAKLLAKRPIVLKIGNLLFTHAGILPIHLDILNNDLNKINKINEAYLLGKELSPELLRLYIKLVQDENSILWNRQYVNNQDQTSYAMLNDVLSKTNTHVMIIGHNTLPHITSLYNNKLWIVDVGLSRSYATDNLEVLEIINQKEFNIIQAVRRTPI